MAETSSLLNSDLLWFEPLSRTNKPALRLYCFPYAGGSADLYRSWQRWFPPQIEVCLVHLPGRGKRLRERAFTAAIPLVNAIAGRMDCETDVPYALYGHSMGALLSFELARELFRRRGPGPQHLFVSGRNAPQWPRSDSATYFLPHDEFISELRRLDGTPQEVLDNPELMELFIPLLRADFEIVETYAYQSGEKLSCPITVYGGFRDKHVPLAGCQAWQEETSAACRVRMVEGGHFFIRNPSQDFVAAFASDVLRTVPASRAAEA